MRVDGVTYSVMGNETPSVNGTANLTDILITPTQTMVTSQVGPMQVNLTFLNPIEVRLDFSVCFKHIHTHHSKPGDWVKQSIPFSYIAFTTNSLDGSAHSVQLYTDITGGTRKPSCEAPRVSPASLQNGTRVIEINRLYGARRPPPMSSITMSDSRSQQCLMRSATKRNGATCTMPSSPWVNHLLGPFRHSQSMMIQGNGITYKIAVDDDSRGMFLLRGVLDNQIDTGFRAISSTFPVFALSSDFGTVQAIQTPVVWTVGYTTDPAISYTDLSGGPPTQRNLYYKSKYSAGDGELVSHGFSWKVDVSNTHIQIVDFLNDFTNASSRAQQLDKKILQDAASVSDPLGDLVSLAIAQVYGSTQLTIGTDALGNFNESDVMMFMKNIGGLASK